MVKIENNVKNTVTFL